MSVPWNKGTKGVCKPNSGSFKKGHIPWNKGLDLPTKPLPITDDLAYVIGVIKGDGSLHHSASNHYRVDLVVKDLNFATSFANSLKGIGINPWCGRKKQTYRGEVRYYPRVTASSKALYRLCNKGWKSIIEQKKSMIIAFIRGFYESEGSLKEINKKQRVRSWRIEIHNSNKELLLLVKRLLGSVGFIFNFGSYYKKATDKRYYYLDTARKVQVANFFKLITPCIKCRGVD